MHLQCGTLQKKQVLTCLASPQKSGFWQPIHLGLSLLHNVLKPRGFLCCCCFFFFVVVVVSAGLLSALCLPGSTFTKLPTPCLQGRAICYFYLVSAVCYNSRPPQGELLFKQHSHIIMIYFFFFLLFWDCSYSLWISNHSYVFIRFGLEHLSCHRVRDGECTGRTCLLNV